MRVQLTLYVDVDGKPRDETAIGDLLFDLLEDAEVVHIVYVRVTGSGVIAFAETRFDVVDLEHAQRVVAQVHRDYHLAHAAPTLIRVQDRLGAAWRDVPVGVIA